MAQNLLGRLAGMVPPSVGPTLGAAWSSVRSVLPDSCLNGESKQQRDEQLHFAKFGRKMHDTELSNLDNGGEGGLQRIDSTGSEEGYGGEFGSSKHKISEWQAGWNVTNAIQVLISSFWRILLGIFGDLRHLGALRTEKSITMHKEARYSN